MMVLATYGAEAEAAIEAVREAGRLCERVRLEMAESLSTAKLDSSPVTVADYGAQALICRSLAARFPTDPIVAEESSEELVKPEHAALLAHVTRFVGGVHPAEPEEICAWIDGGTGLPGERFWVLDPLDGTRGFLRNDQYAIALALIVEGRIVVGALACPSLPWDIDAPEGDRGVLFWSARGSGARTLALESLEPLPGGKGDASRRLVQSLESATSHHALQETIAGKLELGDAALKMDSQAKYGAVARGDACLYLRLPSPATPDYRENIWDHAAGVILVEECGGVVTDSFGERLDFTQGRKLTGNVGIVASRNIDHEVVIDAIAAARNGHQG